MSCHAWLRLWARTPPVQCGAAGTALKALGWCEGSVGLLALQLCELQTLSEPQECAGLFALLGSQQTAEFGKD